MAMTMLYEVGTNLYVNITNRCPCACTFCIRKTADGAYGSDSLWLDHDPSADEIKTAFDKRNLSDYSEIVFCGYGEPLERIETLIEICRYIKAKEGCPPVRLNTNGLSDIINKKPTAHMLEGCIDTVSISLNAGTEECYNRVTNPSFGKGSYDAMLKFADDCKKYVPRVIFTVVDVIPPEEIELARKTAEKMGIEFRVRKYDC